MLEMNNPFSENRRKFLRTIPLALAGACLTPEMVLSDPYAKHALLRSGSPVRVQGAVRAGNKGIGGIRVTNGVSVAVTAPDGTYSLEGTDRDPFVYLSLPDGFAIQQNPTGTARFYQPIQANSQGLAEAVFDLQTVSSANQHAFVVLSDTQTQNAFEMGRLHDETVPDVQATMEAIGLEHTFGVACGDIMFDDLSLYPEYERAVNRMGIPFFQVIGNHDLDFDGYTDESSIRTFNNHFGPGYYSFDRGDVHYVVLDDVLWHTQGYIGYLDEKQLSWLEADLAHIEQGRPVIVFAHIPGLSTANRRSRGAGPDPSHSITNRERLYQLLEPYNAHLLSGHTHENEHVFEGGIHEHIHGTTCGAWWSGTICYDGTPNGYSVYEIDGERITSRYKSTGQPDTHQMRVYPAGSDPAAPGEIVANIWDAHKDWEISWYVGSDKMGRMASRVGKDPLSVAEHTGPDLPSRRTWVEPRLNNHMFYAPAPVEAQVTITIEARDPAGRIYTEKITT